MTGTEYEETVKKWKLREKVGGFPFFFRQIVLKFLMVFWRNPTYSAVRRAEHPTLNGKKIEAERAAMGRTGLPRTG